MATFLGASKSSMRRGNVFTRSKYQWSLVVLKEILVELLYLSGLLVSDTQPLEVYKGPSQLANLFPTRDSS